MRNKVSIGGVQIGWERPVVTSLDENQFIVYRKKQSTGEYLSKSIVDSRVEAQFLFDQKVREEEMLQRRQAAADAAAFEVEVIAPRSRAIHHPDFGRF